VDDVLPKAGTTLDAVATIPPAINKALAPLPGLEISLTHTSDAAGNFINSPAIARAIENIGTAAGNLGEITDNTNTFFYPPPYTGPHPIRHKFEVAGDRALKLIPTVAGAVAIAKGN
jgi:hypothetical protein